MYPTIEQVEKADHIQLAKWFRFLKSPGVSAIGKPGFEEVLKREKRIMDRIVERFHGLGGMTPQISKLIGW